MAKKHRKNPRRAAAGRKAARTRKRKRSKNPSAAYKRASARKGARTRKAGRQRYTSGSHKGKRARTYQIRNRHGKKLFHVRGWRAHKANGTTGLAAAAMAVGAGVLASVAASYLIDQLASSSVTSLQNSTYQDAVLVGLAGVAAWFIPNPAVVGGVATGLLLIPVAKMVYAAGFPSSANTTNTPPLMGSLHRPMGALHRPMGSLHAPMGDLGQGDGFPFMSGGMGALARGSRF